MLEHEREIKDQQQHSLQKLLEYIHNFTSVIPGPLLRIYNHHHIVSDNSEVIDEIQTYFQKFIQSQKNYVKDSKAIQWFIQISILIMHLVQKQKSLRRKMLDIFSKTLNFRKIKSLYHQKSKDIIIIKAFFNVSSLRLFLDNKQFNNLKVQTKKFIKQCQKYQQPLLMIPLSQLMSIRCLTQQILSNSIQEKHIYKTIQLRRRVINDYKQYFDRAILAFYISDTMNIGMRIFQSKSDIISIHQKAQFTKKMYQQMYTKQFFGDSVTQNYRKKFNRIITAQVNKISQQLDRTIILQNELLKHKSKPNFVRKKSLNSFIYQNTTSTTFHKQPYRSLHRFNCNQKSVLKYLLCFQQKKKIQKNTKFSYNCIKQNDVKPVQTQLTPQSLQTELFNITKTESYTKKPLVSFASFKVRKNNSLLSRRLKRISMVLQQQNLSDCSFLSPLRFSKHIDNEISNIEVLFNTQKDNGSIHLIIRQPHTYSQLKIFSVNKVPSLDTAVLISRYKQQLQSSMYYYQFFDGVRDEIQSTDIVDMMLSQLILEYDGRIQKKLLTDYMLIKQYIVKYCYWKHLRKVNKISGSTFELIPIPEVQDFLKFSLFLQNVIESQRVVNTSKATAKSRIKKSMFSILEYINKGKSIVIKQIRKTGNSYYLDMITSCPSNINNVQMVQGNIQITKAKYFIRSYSFKTLNQQQYIKPFEIQETSGKQLITELIFIGYISKCMILSLMNQMKALQDNIMFIGKIKIEKQYRKSLIEDQIITLLDDDYKFDEKIRTPKVRGYIERKMTNRQTSFMSIILLVNLVLQQGLRQVKMMKSKLIFQTMKYYPLLGYYHVSIRRETNNVESLIKFQFKKIQRTKWIIFKIQQNYLNQLYPDACFYQIINRFIINNQQEHQKILLQTKDCFLKSAINKKNKPIFLFKRKICSKIIVVKNTFLVISVYYNMVMNNWEIDIYNQRKIMFYVGSISKFELGIICLNSNIGQTSFTKQDWYIYLIEQGSLPKYSFQETNMWMSLFQSTNLKFEQNYLQMSGVVIYLQRHLGMFHINKKYVEICLQYGQQLQQSTFSIYGYQQHLILFYSTISFQTTKQLYMLDYFYNKKSDRQIIGVFADYLAEKLDQQQYTQPIYIHNHNSYISNNKQVMDIIMSYDRKDLLSRNTSYFNSDYSQQTGKIEIDSEQENQMSIVSQLLSDDNHLFWVTFGKHKSALIMKNKKIVELIINGTYKETLQSLIKIC